VGQKILAVEYNIVHISTKINLHLAIFQTFKI